MFQRLWISALCFLSSPLIALKVPHELPLPLADNVYTTSLSNGIRVYIHEYPSIQQWGSFRVIFKQPSLEHLLYSFDSQTAEWDAVKEFFFACSKKALEGDDRLLKKNYPSSTSSDLNPFPPQEIAIIAVGDFSKDHMLSLIESSFSEIVLDDSFASDAIYINTSAALHHSKVAVSVALPTPRQPISTFEDLKECWKALFLQELLQQQFEECAHKFNKPWIHPHPHYLYPVNGFTLVAEKDAETALSLFFWDLEMLKFQGFYSDSFLAKQQQLLYQLHYLASQAEAPSTTFLASYYKDQFLLGNHCLNPHDFLNASIDCVQEIEFNDLLPLLDPFTDKQNRKIHLVYSSQSRQPPLSEKNIETLEKHISFLASLLQSDDEDSEQDPLDIFSVPSAASLVQFAALRQDPPAQPPAITAPSAPLSSDPFYTLPLIDREKQLITDIITSMASHNVMELAFLKHSLQKKGDKVNHVHPLRFVGHILSSPTLKNDLRTVKKSSFKWDAFVDGFGKRMGEELAHNNIRQYIPGFAALVGTTPEHINPFIDSHDWEGFLKALL